MSDDVRVKGTLKAVKDSEGDSVGILQYLYLNYNLDVVTDCSDLSEKQKFDIFCDLLEEEDIENNYFLFEDKLYKLHDKQYLDHYHCELSYLGDEIHFDASYYSCCGLNEIIQDKLKGQEK